MSNSLIRCGRICPIKRYKHCNCCQVNLLSFFYYNDSNNWSELVSIIAHNDITSLNKLIDKSNKLHITDRFGNTPLHLSVIFKNITIFEYLLSLEKPNINALNWHKQTCMHLAVISDSEYIIGELIKKGVDVNICDEFGCTPLHAAAVRNCPKICEMLLEYGADLNFQNSLGRTPLHHACQYGPMENIYMFLYYDAMVDITDTYGLLPFTAALQQSLNCGGNIPQSHLDCHEVLFNYTFEKSKMSVNLSTLTFAMKINSPLFPEILEKVDHVTFSENDLIDLSQNVIYYKSEYFNMFLRKFSHIVEGILRPPAHFLSFFIEDSEGNIDKSVIKLMEFMTTVFSFRQNFNFVITYKFSYSILCLMTFYKERRLSKEILEQMMYFLYSYGLQCEMNHINIVYKNLGFSEIFKFLLDLDVVMGSVELCKAVMPLLIYNGHLTIDHVIKHIGIPRKEHTTILNFFSGPKIRNLFIASKFEAELKQIPQVPSLVELGRNVAREHIMDTFKVRWARDFFRVLKRMPISEVHKKILTYESEIYGF